MITKLSQVLKNLESQNKAGKVIRNCLLLNLWEQVIDERARRHAEPIKILNQTLYMATSSSAWAQELSLLRREIIAKFNKIAGEEVIREIRFRAKGD